MNNSKALILWFAFTLLNMAVFVFRDHFQYHPYRSYATLYGQCKSDCKDLWIKDYTTKEKTEELIAAKAISTAFIDDSVRTAFSKIVLITDHLYQKLGSRSGLPEEKFRQLGSLEQYVSGMANQKDSFWCGIYTGMVAMFASSHDIVTRQVEIKKDGESHMVVEAYLPEENKWILTDPTFGLLGMKNKNNEWLNLQTFRKALEGGGEIRLLSRVRGQLQYALLDPTQPFLQKFYLGKSAVDYYYHSTVLREVYQPIKKMQRYLLPVSWYDHYSENPPFQFWFYLKITLVFSWLFLSIVLLVRKFSK